LELEDVQQLEEEPLVDGQDGAVSLSVFQCEPLVLL